jgi:hypothetical protein
MRCNKLTIPFFTMALSLGLVILPAFAQDFTFGIRPDDQSIGYYQYTLAPGDGLEDALLALNGTDEPLKLMISVVAGHTALKGGITFPGEADGPAQWINLPNEGIIEVPAQMQMRLPFSLQIPKNIPPGEYVAGFLARPVDPPDITEEGQTFGIKIVSQVGLTMIITVSEPDLCEVTINSVATEINKGNWDVTIHMTNTGNIHFKGLGQFALRPSPEDDPTLLREFNIGYFVAGDSMNYPLSFDDIPPSGEYIADITLMGEDCVFQGFNSQALTITKEEAQHAEEEAQRWALARATADKEAAQEIARAELFRSLANLMLALAGLILVVMIFFVVANRKRTDQSDDSNNKMRPS